MKQQRATPVVLSRTALATAIALLLSGPVSADGPNEKVGQYDSAVTYADYGDRQGSYKLRASDLIGRDIHNAEDDTIGEIDDVIVSRDGDRVMAVISLGSFSGDGSKLVAVPYQDLRVTQDGRNVYYDATRGELQKRSEFSWADSDRRVRAKAVNDEQSAIDGRLSGAVATVDVSRPGSDASHLDRGLAFDEARRADNSAHNADDLAGENLTPLDQSHAEADFGITRSIRKALVDDETLGTNAQNVKVITVDGMVTLRGPVTNAEEQARIVVIAKQAAGQDRVQDELEVIGR
jgi:hyperosmotically inducible periplasmic protein